MKRGFVLSVTQAFILAGLLVRPALAHPPVWMMPPADDRGASLRALFENPQSWRKTRTRMARLRGSLARPSVFRRRAARVAALSDMSWENGIMREGAAYQHAGGRPDASIIESWVQAPPHGAPENAAGTFTRSVLDFTSAFVPGDAADAETPS